MILDKETPRHSITYKEQLHNKHSGPHDGSHWVQEEEAVVVPGLCANIAKPHGKRYSTRACGNIRSSKF